MAELTKADVERYTSGRLDKDDLETERLLNDGLATARRFCGWHVTPVREDVITLDGKGGTMLRLPTLHLVADGLVSIVDDGVTYLPADLRISGIGMVTKRNGGRWSSEFGAITVTMEHGFDTADDFNAAVLSYIDRASLAATGGRARVIGPFQYSEEKLASGAAFTEGERAKLELYRLERAA